MRQKQYRIINGRKCYWHHCSFFRGYVSRKGGPQVVEYSGKFGTGFKELKPNWNSTRYSYCVYWIEEVGA